MPKIMDMTDFKNTLKRREVLIGGALAAYGAIKLPRVFGLTDGDTVAAVSRGANALAAASQCTLTKELTEGPYYVPGEPTRQNITEGIDGMPLILSFRVVDATTCKPIPNANVEIWHADPEGEYSAFDGASKKTSYLRGHQIANASGVAKFITVFPGWYSGRTPHIHVKVHVDGKTVHTGQVFFKTAIEKKIYARAPYTGRSGERVYNSGDNIYKQIGSAGIVAIKRRKSKRGYAGTITLAVDQS
jgi:protocatechuate 3,4-dioxygenase beta subunit